MQQPGAVPQADAWSGASRAGGPGSEGRLAGAMTAVAGLLSMSTDQLGAALAAGQSMSSLASAKGVSGADLMSAIKTGVQDGAPQGAAAPTDTVLNKIATNIANHTGAVTGSTHHHHHGHATPAASAATATAPAPTPAAASTTSSSSPALDMLM